MKREALLWLEEDRGDDFNDPAAPGEWSSVISVWVVTGFAVAAILMLSAWIG
jgi:hypothetical protein